MIIAILVCWVQLVVMLMSGLQIFNAHPSLYWGQAGFSPAHAWLTVGTDARDPERGMLRIGQTAIHTTGVLGVFREQGVVMAKAMPGWLTIPSRRDLASGRRWHFFFAWVLVINGAIYLGTAIVGGHLRRDLWPARAEVSLKHLATDLLNHLRLRFPRGEAAHHYNVLQKLSYLAVILVLVPQIVLTGLTMSPRLQRRGSVPSRCVWRPSTSWTVRNPSLGAVSGCCCVVRLSRENSPRPAYRCYFASMNFDAS